MLSDAGFAIASVDRAECRVVEASWPFALARRAEIDAHWDKTLRDHPAFFDGRVLMQTSGAAETVDGARVYRADFAEVAFREFLAWRDFGFPTRGFRNGFGMAALQGSDGGFVLGEMGPQTANAGRVYFPSGTPDRHDIAGGRVDIEGSIRRELVEETGLDLADLTFLPGLVVIEDEQRTGYMKRVRSPLPAAALADRIRAAIAAQQEPEFAGLHIVRGEADLTPAMPLFVAAFLRHVLAQNQSG